MSIQEIDISNNQKKKLQNSIQNNKVLQLENDGNIVVNVDAYKAFKLAEEKSPLEDIVGEDSLDFSAEYFVFS